MNPEQLFLHLQNPHHYSGKEINRSKKPFSDQNINICLVFPDVYEIGMSHQGIKLLYRLLNNLPDVNAERCFLPDIQSIPAFKEHDVALFSLENRKSINEFDLVAFSLLSELNFTNVLAVLDLAKIPFKSEERKGLPIIAGGGISVINPEPLRNFIDFFAFGDGEFLFPNIVNLFLRNKKRGSDKEQLLSELNALPGFYVPRFFPVKKDGLFFVPETKGKTIYKQSIPELHAEEDDQTPEIVPVGQVVFDRLDLEVARGCPNKCRFCQARQYYAPFRINNGARILEQINKKLKSTGFDTLSLASLSTGDHPELQYILSEIDNVLPPCTAFSFPSLRPRTLSDQMLKKVSQYRRTGLTLVPEAGSERLRRVIGKEVTEEEILSAAENALHNGWQRIKLYFMIGLPTETDEDILAIVDIIEKILDLARRVQKKVELTLSFSTFVPKPHTPFQWAPRLSLEESKRRLSLIKSRLKTTRNIKLDFHSFEKGLIETILSRGDCRVGHLLEDAYASGELFTAWDISFHPETWLKLIEKHRLSFMLDRISTDTNLPWSFLQINQTMDVLKREYNAAQSIDLHSLCTEGKCNECRRCLSVLDYKPDPDHISDTPHHIEIRCAPSSQNFYRYRIFFKKTGDFRYFPHLALQKYIERIIRISGLPFCYSEGFHPRIKISMLPPLPVFAESMCECIEFSQTEDLDHNQMLIRINHVDSPLKFDSVIGLHPQTKSLMKDIKFMSFSYKGPITDEILSTLSNQLLEGESMEFADNKLNWTLCSPYDLAARFGKTYRLLDPDRKHTHSLTRVSLAFHSDSSGGNNP